MSGVPLVEADQASLLARPYHESGDPGPIVAAHSVVALDSALGPDEVRALRQPELDPAAFSDPAEGAVLAWVEAVAGEA